MDWVDMPYFNLWVSTQACSFNCQNTILSEGTEVNYRRMKDCCVSGPATDSSAIVSARGTEQGKCPVKNLAGDALQ
jgi:hypothetical protein